jgi:c(7)-type cytochrome triheme protein
VKEKTKIQIFLVCWLLLFSISPVFASAPGDIVFEREDKSEVEIFPPSVFPHWRHRIHYRCDACHDSLFKMTKGTTPITMDLMAEGKSCGACHNGNQAFETNFANCARCHHVPEN